jgi:transcription initiation factor TFIIE subunit alpha
MDDAATLIRTVVRSLYPDNPRHILSVDLLLNHRMLSVDDMGVLLNSTPKEIRSSLNVLRNSRLISHCYLFQQREDNPKSRPFNRDHYYIDHRKSIDAIKYRVMKLRKKVESLYALDETKRKDWVCPRCKSEYEELEVLDKINDQGFYCDRCGTTLIMNEAANRDRGSHEKIRRLNDQLAKFDELIVRVDTQIDMLPPSLNEQDEAAVNRYESNKIRVQWPKGKEPPKYTTMARSKNKDKQLEQIKAENLQINLTSGQEQEREERERQEQRKKDMAKQNMMPDWYVQSAVGQKEAAAAVAAESSSNGVKSEDADVKAPTLVGAKKEEEDEKKPDLMSLPRTAQENEYAEYLAEMEREAEEQRRQEEEAEDDGEEDDEVDFEDVVPSDAGTPSMSQQTDGSGKVADVRTPVPASVAKPVNGVKRDLDDDDEESSEANTPAAAKRVKLEEAVGNGVVPVRVKDEDSEEDEGDFEDAM